MGSLRGYVVAYRGGYVVAYRVGYGVAYGAKS